VFDVKIADAPVRFRSRGWAYPLDMYVEMLKPLTFVELHRPGEVKDYENIPSLRSGVLEFRRN
jgi:hypothetical protein